MKILIAFHDLMDLGGIINNQEDLYAGLTELGHSVDTVKLIWKPRITTTRTRTKPSRVVGKMGWPMDQNGGWVWPHSAKIPYKGAGPMHRWKERASKYDLIIWQIPVPSKNKNNRGNSDWLELYNVPVKQIAYVHDGNFPARYPWLYAIKDHLCGVGATHPCGYHSLANIDLPRALFFTSQADQEERNAGAGFRDRQPGWFSLQTFKGWKHVDDLVRAVPYMDIGVSPTILAGGGIQWYYMTSKDKCKPEYLVNLKNDPDATDQYIGQRIWERAIECELDYRGYIQNVEREEILSNVRFLIDPSWSAKFAKFGDHPNRVSIDALINGAVPIARNHGIAGSDNGIGEFFKAGLNYVMIPWDATPKEFAEHVDEAMNMGENTFNDMLHEGRKVAALWDNRVVAQHFIDMAEGRPSGVWKTPDDRGTFKQELADKSKQMLEEFFGCE